MSFQPSSYAAHLFDLDDTLINTTQAFKAACQKTLEYLFPGGYGNQESTGLMFFIRLFGSGNQRKFWPAFLAELDRQGKPYQESDPNKISFFFRSQFISQLKPLPGATAFLQHLTERHIHRGIVSNGDYPDRQYQKLCCTGLQPFFTPAAFLVSSMFRADQRKPSPDMIIHSIRQSGIPAAATVFYGDKMEDIIAGNMAGVTTVHIVAAKRMYETEYDVCRPDFVVPDWTQLLSF